MRLLKAKIKTTGEIKEGYLSKKPDDCFLVPVDHNEFEYYNLNSVELMGCAVKPTMPVIVARLCPSWGSRLELLFRMKKPYEHYYDDTGEEVPFAAIVDWQEVLL